MRALSTLRISGLKLTIVLTALVPAAARRNLQRQHEPAQALQPRASGERTAGLSPPASRPEPLAG
jgi:hypothetical protein